MVCVTWVTGNAMADLHHVNAMCCSCLSNQLHADSPRVLASVKSLLMSDSAEL